MDDGIRRRDLFEQLEHRMQVGERAERRRTPDRDLEYPVTAGPQPIRHLPYHRRATLGRLDIDDLRAQKLVEERVGRDS